jgi:hypothetical protein
MRFRILSLIALLLVLGATAQPLWAQSLADLAKQEAERRKNVKDTGKVYTNDDLGGAKAPAADAAADATKDAKDAKDTKDASDAKDGKATDDKAKAKDDSGTKDQQYWADRAKGLRTQLDRDQTYADALQTQLSSLQADFVNRDDPIQRSAIAQNQQKVSDELDHLKLSIQGDKEAISNLEEEARRAGVPPGWLR